MKKNGVPWCLLLLWPMMVTILVSYAVGEWYPLSSFPMYSKFEERTYYVYLADASGDPLPTIKFQILASDLKKHYGDELDKLKSRYEGSHYEWDVDQRRLAGEEVLRFLREEWLPSRAPDVLERGEADGLILYEVRVFYEDGVFQKTETAVGGRLRPEGAGQGK